VQQHAPVWRWIDRIGKGVEATIAETGQRSYPDSTETKVLFS